MIRLSPKSTDRIDVVVPAPTDAEPHREVALVSVVLPDGREARFHVTIHAGARGQIVVHVESKRVWRGKPTRCALTLAALSYADPETGAPSAFVRAASEGDAP